MCLMGDKCHCFLIYFDCQMVSVVKTMKKDWVKNVCVLFAHLHACICVYFVQIHANVCTFGREYNFRLVDEFVFYCCSSKLP